MVAVIVAAQNCLHFLFLSSLYQFFIFCPISSVKHLKRIQISIGFFYCRTGTGLESAATQYQIHHKQFEMDECNVRETVLGAIVDFVSLFRANDNAEQIFDQDETVYEVYLRA